MSTPLNINCTNFTNRQFACVMFLLTVYGLQCISGVITGCGENKWSLDTWFTVSAIYGFFYCFIAMITLSEKSISPCVHGFCFVVNAVSVVWQFVLLGVPMKGCWSPLFEANYIISWFTLVPIVYLMWGIMGKSTNEPRELRQPIHVRYQQPVPPDFVDANGWAAAGAPRYPANQALE